MKLEVGQFLRTKCGLITKIQSINEYNIALMNTCCQRQENKYFMFPNEEKIYEITKSNHNIIDLIEVRDFVNGKLIHKIQIKNDGTKLLEYGNGKHIKIIEEVLTHEQYEANCYKVVE